MPFVDAPRQVFDLEAGAVDDPDCTRTAAVLTAYLNAEQRRALRRRLWPRLAALAAAWLALGILTSLFSVFAVASGLFLLLALAVATAIAEWRASERLSGLLRVHSAIVSSRPASTSSS